MNLISLLFGNRPAAAQPVSAYRRESQYRPTQIAPEVWANFGVEVSEIEFDEFESTPGSSQSK